jgi:hypothetical protein
LSSRCSHSVRCPVHLKAPSVNALLTLWSQNFPMARATLLNGLRLIIAFAVMMSALPSLRVGPAFQEVATYHTVDAFVQAGLADEASHGHSHDDNDGSGTEHPPGHGPEHKDHSHLTLGLAALPESLSAPDGKLLREWDHCREPADPSWGLDRPPRSLFVA